MLEDRSLVLGGGVARIAWMTGLPAGLAEVGQDVTGADVIIGTSAGAAGSRPPRRAVLRAAAAWPVPARRG